MINTTPAQVEIIDHFDKGSFNAGRYIVLNNESWNADRVLGFLITNDLVDFNTGLQDIEIDNGSNELHVNDVYGCPLYTFRWPA